MNEDERWHAQQRLVVMEGLVAAQERRVEVLDAVSRSADAEEALAAVMALLALPEPHVAQAVLDMQTLRWTKDARQRMQTERDELREKLNAT
jgi:DNA gyrase/topoisomerase IV subunit A